jgi:hypothetical protein
MLTSRRTPKALLTACLLLLATASVSQAAGPASVTVRVEGSEHTLLAPTTVTTTNTPVDKDGDPTHTCNGLSAAGALEQATSGGWGGSWFGIGYSVETILGETHAFDANASANFFWGYWLDNRSSEVGVCEGELSAGESILFFPECFSSHGSCPPSPNPLGIAAPAIAEAGSPVPVAVTSYANPSGAASPAVGASVTGGGAAATTDASGHASVTLSQLGNVQLTVNAPDAVRSETTVCVHTGNDGNCGTPIVSGSTSTVVAGAATRPVYKGPYAVVARATGVLDGHVYPRAKAPRLLRGTALAHTQIASVGLRLRRSYRGRCFAYDGTSERFARVRCGGGSFFKVASTPSFSYLLPGALQRGRYVLDIEATDTAGNRTSLSRGSSRVVFYVR